jgi:hypothetical protein
MHLLVNHSKDVVQNRLVSELYKEDLFGELLYEDDGIKAEREKCERLLETYKEAAIDLRRVAGGWIESCPLFDYRDEAVYFFFIFLSSYVDVQLYWAY